MAKSKPLRGRMTRTYVDGAWHDGSPPVLAPDSQAMWLSSIVFDGARAMGGHVPDLDRHCRRLNRSAEILNLKPTMTAEEIEALAGAFGNSTQQERLSSLAQTTRPERSEDLLP